MKEDATRQAILTGGSAGAAGILIYVLAEAWVSGIEERQTRNADAAAIAIKQASAHGLNLDQLERKMDQIERAYKRFEFFAAEGGRFTAQEGRALMRRVERLESILLKGERHTHILGEPEE